MDNETRVYVPEMCKTHQSLLVGQANYSPRDPWRALVIMANVTLFQGASCDPKVHEEIGGDIGRISELGCLACRKPDLFGEVVEAAKSREPGALKALGEQWIAVAHARRQPASQPSCAVCAVPYERHGTYPTCSNHPYTADATCQCFVGAACPGAECANGCAMAKKHGG